MKFMIYIENRMIGEVSGTDFAYEVYAKAAELGEMKAIPPIWSTVKLARLSQALMIGILTTWFDGTETVPLIS